MQTTVKQVKQAIGSYADTVGKNKAGNIVLRKGYYYRNGASAESFENNIVAALSSAGVLCKVVDRGDVWKPFRGGASVAQQSHFYVELAV
jgi:hypothetical protein